MFPAHPSDEHFRTDSTSRRPNNKMQSIDIQSFSYEERGSVLSTLTSSFTDCGGWVLRRKTLSATNMEFHLEIQLRDVIDLYAGILSAGVELTRAAHLALG